MHEPRFFRLFISSTFSDFKAERQALQTRVFPELEALCREYGATFQAIDLRWGITEEAQRSHDTLRLCLEEIRRCQALSSKPNFAVLLGDRYGWEPLPARIPESHWKRLLSMASDADQELVRGAYVGPDRNAIPAVYQLKKRKGDRVESQIRERLLLQALRRAADSAGFTGEERLAFFASATHQEIALGALAERDENGKTLHPEEHVHVYVRRVPDLPRDESARAFLDWDSEIKAPDEKAHRRLRFLEAELNERLPERFRTFTARWRGDGIDTAYLDAFCQTFLEDHKAIIKRQCELAAEQSASQIRNRAHFDFATERARNFRGRNNVLRRVERYLQGRRRVPLVLYGEGGTGKSALLSRAFEKARSSRDPVVMLPRFIGGIAATDDLYTLLTTLTEDLAAAYGHPKPFPVHNIEEAIESFHQALTWSTAERPLVLFLDALDQLENRDGAWLLQWLPEELTEHTRIVASTRGGPTLHAAQRRFQTTCIELPPMPPAEGRAMLKAWLADARDAYYNAGIAPIHAHRLTREQFNRVIETFEAHGNPLWLKLAYENVRHWTSFEAPKVLPPTVTAMIEELIDHRLIAVENHPKALTARTLSYLTAARFGLSEEELTHALATDPEVRAEFETQNAKTRHQWDIDPNRPRLPPVLWSRLCIDLAPYLVSAFVDQTLTYRWFHREFGEVIRRRYLSTPEQWETTHGHLADMFAAIAPGNDALFHLTDISGRPQSSALRRVMEQPWQLARAGREAELASLLSDFGFCMAKCAANRSGELVSDWLGLRCEPSSELAYWQEFLQQQGYLLSRGDKYWPAHKILLQVSAEHEPGSSVGEAAMTWLAHGYCDWIWFKRGGAPEHRQCKQALLVLEGHTDTVSGALALSDGRFLSWSRDHTLRLWDSNTGEPLAVLQGHTSPVKGAFALADGPLVSWSWDCTLRLWDEATGAPLAVLGGHTGPVNGVLTLSDGRLVSWSEDHTLRLWNGTTGTPLVVMAGHTDSVTDVVVLNDGRLLSCSVDCTLRLWDSHTGIQLAVLREETGVTCLAQFNGVLVLSDNHALAWFDSTLTICNTKTLTAVAHQKLANDRIEGAVRLGDERALIWSNGGEIRLWNLQDASISTTLGTHDGTAKGALVLSNNEVVTWGNDGTLRFWDHIKKKSTRVIDAHAGEINGVTLLSHQHLLSWSKLWDRLLTSRVDNSIRLWDLKTGACLAAIEQHRSSDFHGVVALSASRLASYSADLLRIWTIDETSIPTPRSPIPDIECWFTWRLPENQILTWSRDGPFWIWDVETEAPVLQLHGHDGWVNGALVLPDGRLLTWSRDWPSLGWEVRRDATIRIWNRQTGSQVAVLEGHQESVSGVLVLGTDRLLSWSYDGSLRIWDTGTGFPVAVLEGHTKRVSGALPLANDRILSWSHDGTLRLWTRDTGASLAVLEGHTKPVLGVITLSDGRLVSRSEDCTLRVWDGDTGRQLSVLSGHSDSVYGPLVLPGGRLLSWSHDHTLRLWDSVTGLPVAVLEGHTDWVNGALMITGDRVLSWSSDGTLRLWASDTGAPLAVLDAHEFWVEGVAVLTNDRFISWGPDQQVRLWSEDALPLAIFRQPWIETENDSGLRQQKLDTIAGARRLGRIWAQFSDKKEYVALVDSDAEWRARWHGDAKEIVGRVRNRLIVHGHRELIFLTAMRGGAPTSIG